MAQPLTDAIEALTTYANTVTGASDTTLSDAVATLANGYGGGVYDALYPMTCPRTDGVATFNLRISENNGHIKLTFPNAISGSYLFINLTDLVANSSATSAVNNRALWFQIPTGTLTHTISNVSNTSNITWNANFRSTGTTSLAYGIGDGTHETGETVTASVTTVQNVGCYFVYIATSTLSIGAVLEFDVNVTINGTRYL